MKHPEPLAETVPSDEPRRPTDDRRLASALLALVLCGLALPALVGAGDLLPLAAGPLLGLAAALLLEPRPGAPPRALAAPLLAAAGVAAAVGMLVASEPGPPYTPLHQLALWLLARDPRGAVAQAILGAAAALPLLLARRRGWPAQWLAGAVGGSLVWVVELFGAGSEPSHLMPLAFVGAQAGAAVWLVERRARPLVDWQVELGRALGQAVLTLACLLPTTWVLTRDQAPDAYLRQPSLRAVIERLLRTRAFLEHARDAQGRYPASLTEVPGVDRAVAAGATPTGWSFGYITRDGRRAYHLVTHGPCGQALCVDAERPGWRRCSGG